jgi:6-phosphogluconolactonase
MQIEVLADPDAVAERAAVLIASEARTAVTERRRFVMAVSGGHTPWMMLRALAGQQLVPWSDMHVFQVDERVAPQGDADRNLTHLSESLLSWSPLPPAQVHPMPVEHADLTAAAESYAVKLREIAGSPPTLDLVHLGLGPDGHTASLVPGDPVLAITDMTVAMTGEYQGHRRMTLTYPVLNHARRIIWVVTGSDKARILRRLQAGDHGLPAGRVCQTNALVLADLAATGSQRRGRR